MSDTSPQLLVTGASGNLGQAVLDYLLEYGANNIIGMTRSPEKLADYAERGVTVRQGDFDDPASLETAFADVDRLLLISTDAVDLTDRRLNQHLAAVSAAEKAGIKHVVYTSLTSADDTPVKFSPDHHGTEQALATSSMNWTILRNNLYSETLLMALPRAYQIGTLFSAAQQGKVGYVTRQDCARAAAAALMSDYDGKRILDITGPEALSQSDLAAIASEVTGTPLTYQPVPLQVIIDGMVGAGVPEPVAQIFASFDTAIAGGKHDVVTAAVEVLTGTPPTTVKEFLMANKAAF